MKGKRPAPRATAARGPYHHGNLRQALLVEAARLAAERGTEAVTLREVARRAGVSHAAPYHHFRDKQEMLGAVAEAGFEKLDAAMRRALRGAPADPYERLRRMGVAYIRFATTSPHYYRVMFKPELRGVRHGGEVDPNTAAGRAFQQLLDAVSACRQAVGDTQADPFLWAFVAWTITHGVSSLWLEGALQGGPLGRLGIRRISDYVTHAVAPAFRQPPPR